MLSSKDDEQVDHKTCSNKSKRNNEKSESISMLSSLSRLYGSLSRLSSLSSPWFHEVVRETEFKRKCFFLIHSRDSFYVLRDMTNEKGGSTGQSENQERKEIEKYITGFHFK